jgi:hypothetical protein
MGDITNFFGINIEKDEKSLSADSSEVLSVFEIMRPKASSYPLMRIGGDRDGSYLIPEGLEGIAACFSPGVHNYKYFEDYLVDVYGIKCHMCDFSSDVEKFKTPLKEGMQTFQKKWLDVENGKDNIILEDWVNENAPEGDLLLQIDIEGAEYRNILSAPDDVLSRFRIIVMEVHDLAKMLEPGILRQVILPFFAKIGKYFDCVHAHPNNSGGEFNIPGTEINIPTVLELTFIRRDRLNQDALLYKPLLPHPLDISGNIPRRPPMFLGEGWLEGERPPETRIEILERKLRFQEFLRGVESRESETDNIYELFARSLQTINQRQPVADIPEKAAARLEEVATGCRFKLSGAARGYIKRGVVAEKEDFFFHTEVAANPYIQIDLAKSRVIRKITIANRRDGFFDRAKVLFCVLSDSPDRDSGSVFPINTTKAFLTGEELELDVILPATKARYVTICSPLTTALHFSAVRIFAKRRKQEVEQADETI